jgi:hypothetical protein
MAVDIFAIDFHVSCNHKRYVELSKRLSDGLPDPRNRNYRTSDLPIRSALAAATAANAVTIFALYIFSETVAAMYSRPLFLWLICPLLIYFLGRALMLAHRGGMHDDPIAFALSDPDRGVVRFFCPAGDLITDGEQPRFRSDNRVTNIVAGATHKASITWPLFSLSWSA